MVTIPIWKKASFWLAVVGVLQSLLFYYVTDVPQSIWIAIDALIGVVIASLTVNDAVTRISDSLREVTSELKRLFV
jgi:divalent metal cation (Fe/Co/Zn/Cd) transporter